MGNDCFCLQTFPNTRISNYSYGLCEFLYYNGVQKQSRFTVYISKVNLKSRFTQLFKFIKVIQKDFILIKYIKQNYI